MRWVLLGLGLLALVAVILIGTDRGAFLVQRGLLPRPVPSATTPFRLTPPKTAAPIVISKSTTGGQYCVRYEIRGTTQQACTGVIGSDQCYDVARVGEPLPEGCR